MTARTRVAPFVRLSTSYPTPVMSTWAAANDGLPLEAVPREA
ncbi:MAG: hypothetical protein ACYTGR_12465 [Planctomycetota bacterium]|jgi:hypothetical protein